MFTAEHWELVKNLATKLKSDGCTDVPDLWFRVCCCEHDINYRTHRTPEGDPITRWAADRELRKCIQQLKPDHWSNPIAWGYWLGVRLMGDLAWRKCHCTDTVSLTTSNSTNESGVGMTGSSGSVEA